MKQLLRADLFSHEIYCLHTARFFVNLWSPLIKTTDWHLMMLLTLFRNEEIHLLITILLPVLMQRLCSTNVPLQETATRISRTGGVRASTTMQATAASSLLFQ